MPDSFYYYCAVNNEDRKSWLGQILTENQIYFRHRDQLNDPNELRPTIILSGTQKQFRQYAQHLLNNYSPNKLPPAKRLQEENKLINQFRNKSDFIESTLHELLDKVGVICLSESPTDPLLWAHYADGNRGVCIEFDANIGLFLAAKKVLYTDQEPVINRLIDNNDQILEKSFFTKGTHWSYEKEWRVIARWMDQDRIDQYFAQHHIPSPLRSFMLNQHGVGHYSFPPEAIRSVILGKRIKPEIETWLRETLSTISPPIAIRQQGTDHH